MSFDSDREQIENRYVQTDHNVNSLQLSTFLSQFGGQMGFLLGMSIVGIIEIFILCTTLGKEQCCGSDKKKQ